MNLNTLKNIIDILHVYFACSSLQVWFFLSCGSDTTENIAETTNDFLMFYKLLVKNKTTCNFETQTELFHRVLQTTVNTALLPQSTVFFFI